MVIGTSLGSTKDFIKSLSLPKKEAKGVLQNFDDCKEFYIGHYGRNKHVVDDILDFREKKIEESEITLDTFCDMCYHNGVEDSFLKTFYQSITSFEAQLIDNAIESGSVSLEDIYEGFTKNPNKNILRYVL